MNMPSPEDKALELILLYNMTAIEAKAFKIACIYLEKANKFFPNYQHYRMPKGDPRKSEIFRYCFTLLRQTQDKIADEDYKLYVHAQLDIMRVLSKNSIHPFITPACLAGKKAWRRWLMWKGRYDKYIELKKSSISASSTIKVPVEKIQKDLQKTKQFFFAWFDRLDSKDIIDSLNDHNMFRWYQTGNVSGYYLFLSPIFNKWLTTNQLNLKKEFNLDLIKYKDAVQASDYFFKEFTYEKCEF